MFLRKSLVIAVIAFAGVVAAPAQSQADTTILVQEGTISTSGGTTTFTPTGTAQTIDLGVLSQPGGSIPTITTTNFTIFGTVGLNVVGNSISISTALNLATTATGTQGLEVVVTDPDLTNSSPGAPSTFTNDVSGTLAGTGVTIAASGTTTISGVTSPASTSEPDITNGNVSNLPSPFSITQTLLLNVTPPSGGASSFTSGISTVVNTNAVPVPAPGGLALALIGLPLLGLRRVLRRKAGETAI